MTKLAIDARMVRHSGIGTYIRHIVPHLCTELHEFDVTLLGCEEKLSELDLPESARIVNCDADIYSLQEQRDFLRFCRHSDLLWVPHFNVPLNIPLLPPVRFVCTIHDVLHVSQEGRFMGHLQRSIARVYLDRVRRRAAGITFVSAFSRQEFERYIGPCTCPTDIIHSLVAPEWFGPHEQQRAHEAPYLIFVGNVKRHKNLRALVDAFRELQERIPHHLVIVGKAAGLRSADSDLIRAVDTLGDRVHFTGEIDDRTLRNFVANADLMVFPSLYEGFGLPPLEAMAAGCPALVSTAASIPEICGDAPHYFNAADLEDLKAKIVQCLNDPELRAQLVRRGRSVAQHYTWQKAYRRTARFLRRIATGDPAMPERFAA